MTTLTIILLVTVLVGAYFYNKLDAERRELAEEIVNQKRDVVLQEARAQSESAHKSAEAARKIYEISLKEYMQKYGSDPISDHGDDNKG